MRKVVMLLTIAVQTLYCVDTRAEGLCSPTEAVLFNCQFLRSTSSLCVSEQGITVYRAGSRSKIRLEIFEKQQKKELFRLSSRSLVGGGESHVRFGNGDYTYFLFDKMSTTENTSNTNAGVIVFHKTKKVSSRTCSNDASLRKEAYEVLPREDYRDLESVDLIQPPQ